MQLPKQLELAMMQSRWSAILDPFIANPSLNSIILFNVSLGVGVTVVNHLLGRLPKGWRVVDVDAATTIYRSAPFTHLNLTLTSSAAAKVSLEVF